MQTNGGIGVPRCKVTTKRYSCWRHTITQEEPELARNLLLQISDKTLAIESTLD